MSAKITEPRAHESSSAKLRAKHKRKGRASGPQHELTALALKACLIARDAAYNIKDLLTNASRMAFLTLRDCEKELDQIERDIDERQFPRRQQRRSVLDAAPCDVAMRRDAGRLLEAAQEVADAPSGKRGPVFFVTFGTNTDWKDTSPSAFSANTDIFFALSTNTKLRLRKA